MAGEVAEAERQRAGMNRKNEKKTIGLAALLAASQLLQAANVSAASQEYSGVTQIASEDVYLDVSDLEVSLESGDMEAIEELNKAIDRFIK